MRVISQHGPPVYPIDVPDHPTATSSDTGSPKSSASGGVAQHGKVSTIFGADLYSSASTGGELVEQPTTPRGTAAVADIFVKLEADDATAGVNGTVIPKQDPDPAAMFGGKAPVLDDFWPDVERGREIIKRMSVEDVARHWKQFLHDVTGQLVIVQKEEAMTDFTSSRAAADGSRGDAAAGLGCSSSMKKITDLVEKYSFLIKTAQQLNPGKHKMTIYCRMTSLKCLHLPACICVSMGSALQAFGNLQAVFQLLLLAATAAEAVHVPWLSCPAPVVAHSARSRGIRWQGYLLTMAVTAGGVGAQTYTTTYAAYGMDQLPQMLQVAYNASLRYCFIKSQNIC